MRLRSSTPVFLVSDIAATMHWYQANLRFQADPFPESPPHVFCILSKDGVEIMLQQLAGYEKPDLYRKRDGGVWDVYLRMEGVVELFQAVSKAGEVTILEPLRRQPYGAIEFVIRDPNGYTLVFAEAVRPLPFNATLEQYEKEAEQLLGIYRSSDTEARWNIAREHPRLRELSDPERLNAVFELADARLSVAREYGFENWAKLAGYAKAVRAENSPVARFESAVEAVIAGDVATLASILREDPDLACARSVRPHRATLLHYLAANGVEGYRQRTPQNAVEIARVLVKAGAEVDALADMYDGHYTAMSMLVSSGHPAKAGAQIALVETLLDFGAAVEARGSARWGSPLMTALAFGYLEVAEALVRRGARVDNIATAAGLGRAEETRRLLATADGLSRHRAFALAAQHGHVEIVRMLLDAGEDPNRYNPDGNHGHSTPLHQAVWSGHDAVVRLLVERGADVNIKDTVHQGTPLDWGLYHGKREDIAEYLHTHGARAS